MKNQRIKSIAVVLLILLAGTVYAEYIPSKISLSMIERFTILSLLPEKASFADWKIINDLRNELAPNEAERKALDLKPTPDGGVTGNWDAVPDKEIGFGEVAISFVAEALKKLDGENNLSQEHISLYEKFVVNK